MTTRLGQEREATMKPISETIGDLKLAAELFGDKDEITWLQDDDCVYHRITLTRDGRIDCKDEDKWDHDTTYFAGTYSLTGTKEAFTVIGVGEATAYYDSYKSTKSEHHDEAVTQRFESSSFTGDGFVVTYK